MKSTHCSVQSLNVQSDRLGLLVGRIEKKLCFLFPFLHRCAEYRFTQNVVDLLSQRCNVIRQTVPAWKNIILLTLKLKKFFLIYRALLCIMSMDKKIKINIPFH